MTSRSCGFVYFIRAERLDLIKIGWTREHPDRRLLALRRMCPDRLVPLGVIRGHCRRTELDVHRRFGGQREHGEWFRSSERLLGYIAAKARPWPGPEAGIVVPEPTGERSRKAHDRSMEEMIEWALEEEQRRREAEGRDDLGWCEVVASTG